MSNLQSQMSPRVPTYLPLSDAAKKYGLSEKVLTQMVQAGKIEAVQLPTGDLLVAAENNGHNEPKTKEEIIAKDYHHPAIATTATRLTACSRRWSNWRSKNTTLLTPAIKTAPENSWPVRKG
jgi:hypothetical protein